MVTHLFSDVASCPTLGRRVARPSVGRLQSPGVGSDLETKRSALLLIVGTHLSVGTYEYSRLHCCTPVPVSHKMEHKKPRQVGSSALATSLRRQTRGSQPWLGRLDPTRRAAHPARLFAAPNHKNSSWFRRLLESLHTHTIYLKFPHRKTVSICQVHI